MGDVFGVPFGVPPSILHEYPSAAGFPNDMISSGVATFECRRPVSSNFPSCCTFPAKRGEGDLSTDKGDTMLSLLSFLVYALSAEDVFPWPQDGATMLSLTFSADEGLRSTTVGVGYTRLISTVSAEEILRSVQRGGETMLSLTRLALLCWQYSMSLSFGLSIGNSRLLVSVEETSSGRRIRSLSESLAKGLRGGRVLLQKGSEDCDGYKCLQIMRSWRRAGMEATAMPMFCSRLEFG